MKKQTFKLGQRVCWKSNIVGRLVYGVIEEIGSFFKGGSYIVFEDGTDHKWEIGESKLKKA